MSVCAAAAPAATAAAAVTGNTTTTSSSSSSSSSSTAFTAFTKAAAAETAEAATTQQHEQPPPILPQHIVRAVHQLLAQPLAARTLTFGDIVRHVEAAVVLNQDNTAATRRTPLVRCKRTRREALSALVTRILRAQAVSPAHQAVLREAYQHKYKQRQQQSSHIAAAATDETTTTTTTAFVPLVLADVPATELAPWTGGTTRLMPHYPHETRAPRGMKLHAAAANRMLHRKRRKTLYEYQATYERYVRTGAPRRVSSALASFMNMLSKSSKHKETTTLGEALDHLHDYCERNRLFVKQQPRKEEDAAQSVTMVRLNSSLHALLSNKTVPQGASAALESLAGVVPYAVVRRFLTVHLLDQTTLGSDVDF